MSRLALGSAQFGLDYGITNQGGRIAEKEVAAILNLAADSGIDAIDTAHLYGESESVIGKSAASANFRIVTKTGKYGNAGDAGAQLRVDFDASLKALCRTQVYGLLIHDAGDLLGTSGEDLWFVLETFKRLGEVSKIGVSVYNPDEIDRILDRFPIDIIQLPFNAIDQRLVADEHLSRLAAAGVEIHARSLFLQGLLLTAIHEIPSKFGPIREAVQSLDASFTRQGLSRLEGLLAVAFRQREIDRFIVGVTSAAELDAIILAAERANRVEGLQIPALAGIDEIFLNPVRWGEIREPTGEKDAQ